jgi:hypothetical protein
MSQRSFEYPGVFQSVCDAECIFEFLLNEENDPSIGICNRPDLSTTIKKYL